MKKYLYTIEQAAKGALETPIEYSIPLIVTALQYKKFKQENHHIKNKYLDSLLKEMRKKQTPDGYLAWLFGRVIYSNKLTKTNNELDNVKLIPIKNFVSNIEKSSNEFEAWALGYFSMDSGIYNKKSSLFQTQASSLDKVADKLWAYSMFLSACAINNDKNTYESLKNGMIESVQARDTIEALEKIPLNDYQGWALGLNLISESTIDRKSPLVPILLTKLEEISKVQTIENDKVLAESYLFHYNENYS